MTMTPEMVRQIACLPIPTGFNGSFTLHCHEGRVKKVKIEDTVTMPERVALKKVVDSPR